MATIVERKLLEALDLVRASVDTSKTDMVGAIDSLDIHVSNEDVVSAISTLTSSVSSTNSGITSLGSNITSMNTNLAAKIQAQSPIVKASIARLTEILSASIPALTPVRLFTANSNRVGFVIYNNSTNSLYCGPTNSPAGGKLFFQLATNAGPTAAIQCFGPMVWTGEIWVLRNSGIGGVIGYEFEP